MLAPGQLRGQRPIGVDAALVGVDDLGVQPPDLGHHPAQVHQRIARRSDIALARAVAAAEQGQVLRDLEIQTQIAGIFPDSSRVLVQQDQRCEAVAVQPRDQIQRRDMAAPQPGIAREGKENACGRHGLLLPGAVA